MGKNDPERFGPLTLTTPDGPGAASAPPEVLCLRLECVEGPNAGETWGEALDSLRHATNAGGSWLTTNVDSAELASLSAGALALDSAGGLHIMHSTWKADHSGTEVQHFASVAGSWVLQEIIDIPALSVFLRFDRSDAAHIAYTETESLDLMYAVRDGVDNDCDGGPW